MIKLLVRLFRSPFGRPSAAAGEPARPNPQLQVDLAKLQRAKKALARVVAQDRSVRRREMQLEKLIASLEDSVLAALAKERDDLALNGASAIADLEAERHEATLAVDFAAQRMIRLRAMIARTESRLNASASHVQKPWNAASRAEKAAKGPRPRSSAEDVLARLRA